MIAFLFPGQGSQRRGMGQELFDSVPEYAKHEADIDRLLGYSMRQLCLHDEGNRLKQTRFTQPSLYVVNALHFYKALSDGLRPTYLAGHSVGEYNALFAAGAFDFMTGLRLVMKRGELMSQASDGAMAAVIGLSAGKIQSVLKENRLTTLDVANFNTPTQIVVSGPAQDIQRAGAAFESAGASMYVPLQVSAAFHSRYVADAAGQFAEYLAPLHFVAPTLPVISNVTAQPYPSNPVAEAIKVLLVRQITESVRWTQSVRYLMARGVTQFKELGPGNVLARLVQQIQQQNDD